jgi:hypothetical protein
MIKITAITEFPKLTVNNRSLLCSTQEFSMCAKKRHCYITEVLQMEIALIHKLIKNILPITK